MTRPPRFGAPVPVGTAGRNAGIEARSEVPVYTLEESIKWKDGSTWPAGSDVTIQWGEDHRGPYVVSRGYGVHADTRKCSGRTLGKALAGYFPGLEELEEYVYDSVCESPTGHTVEPDGWGPDGVPSWLILAGLI